MRCYVAVDIGCLECGEESDVLGIFTSEEGARQAQALHKAWQAKHWSGQHEFKVFAINTLNVMMPLPSDDLEKL